MEEDSGSSRSRIQTTLVRLGQAGTRACLNSTNVSIQLPLDLSASSMLTVDDVRVVTDQCQSVFIGESLDYWRIFRSSFSAETFKASEWVVAIGSR